MKVLYYSNYNYNSSNYRDTPDVLLRALTADHWRWSRQPPIFISPHSRPAYLKAYRPGAASGVASRDPGLGHHRPRIPSLCHRNNEFYIPGYM